MKLVNVVGARPQFIKIGPILRAIDAHNEKGEARIDEVLIHTGQHYDAGLSKIFFEQLQIKEPDYNLGVGSGTQAEQTGEMLKRIEAVLLDEKPDWVMVYGDTNTTLAGALAAAKLHIPIAHVEAGLRSFNKLMPEEINRILTDHMSELLFCPTQPAVENLANEGITSGVHQVGDVMYDSVLHYSAIAEGQSSILEDLGLSNKNYALATVHRAENTDDASRLRRILSALDRIAMEGLEVILPIHPRTRNRMSELELVLTHARVIEPVSYLDMLLLQKNAHAILTDSGGIQKEAFFFRVPCVTLRDETEWVETVESGWNTLVGADVETICRATEQRATGGGDASFYGEGHAAEEMINHLSDSMALITSN